MPYITVEDFLDSVKPTAPLTREQERALVMQTTRGDAAAREALRRAYMPMVAGCVRRAPAEIRTLHTVYAAIATLEKGLDTFDFQQEGETFAHHLSWRLRQCLTRCIAQR